MQGIGAVTSTFTGAAEKSDRLAGLSALVRNDSIFGKGSIGETREHLYSSLEDYQPAGADYSFNDWGMNAVDFGQSAERRIRQRGFSEGGIDEAYYQEALERVFSLDAGALGRAGQYDRYGTNATDAISNLVASISGKQGSGVSTGNYGRVQEYLNMQQALMQQHQQFTATPNANLVNREIVGMVNMSNNGYVMNPNSANDMQIARNALTNPQNDRMRALLYGTVEEMDSKYAGRDDLIDRAINDPEKQGDIMQAYFKKIHNMYGGTNTREGYNAFKSLLPGMNTKQRDAFVKGVIEGDLTNEQITKGMAMGGANKDLFASQSKDYVSETTKLANEMQESINSAISDLGNTLSGAIDKLGDKISKWF